jgi:hypothetical protein
MMKKSFSLLLHAVLFLSLLGYYGCSKGGGDTPPPPPTSTDTTFADINLTPSSGVVGTNIVSTVKVRTAYVSKVSSMWLDISSTGEHLTMSKGTDNATWTQDKLWVPETSSNTYPRTDTFTFTAYDAGGSVLKRGTATFTVTGNNNPNSANVRIKAGYSREN